MRISGKTFFEEAFGGLVREMQGQGVDFDLIKKTVKIVDESSRYDMYIEKINNYMLEAAQKRRK